MSIKMQPDIDTMDFIYSFERVDGVTEDQINQILDELCIHMRTFCKGNNIWDFYLNVVIDIRG